MATTTVVGAEVESCLEGKVVIWIEVEAGDCCCVDPEEGVEEEEEEEEEEAPEEEREDSASRVAKVAGRLPAAALAGTAASRAAEEVA